MERVGRSWALWIWLCLRWVSHWLHKRELAAFSSIAFYMQTSLAELQFPSSCTLSFPLSLAILLCFSLGSYIYSCVYMSIWVWVWVLVCACEWVSAHSFAHALIHFHHLYVVKSAEFNVLRLSDLHLLMLTLSSSLLPFPLLFSLFIFPFFFSDTYQIELWFRAPYLRVRERCVAFNGFPFGSSSQKKQPLPLPPIFMVFILVSLKSCRVIFVYESLNIFKWFSKIKLTVYNCLGWQSPWRGGSNEGERR